MHRTSILLAALASGVVQAQGTPTDAGTASVDFADLSLEQLLETPVAAASVKGAATSSRESPAIVTVITREEIRDLGARDLIDVLRYVPGFDFTSDVEGTVGLSVRGISTLEGKALMLVDGMPINDLTYGNVLFGNREAIDLIERIEIIRGPGSTIYGGFAELAVINVVTHPAVPVDRVLANLTYGQLPTAPGRATVSLLGSHSFGDLNLRASAFTGASRRSDLPYNVDGTEVNMRDYSAIQATNVSIGADWKGLTAQFIYDDYRTDSPVYDSFSQPLHKSHTHLYGSLQYSVDLGEHLTLNAFGSYQNQLAWKSTDQFAIDYEYYGNKPIDRLRGGLSLLIKPIDQLRILVGGTYNHDSSTVPPTNDPTIQKLNTYFNPAGEPTSTLVFNNVAGFAEVVGFTPWVNITAGARYEYNSVYGSSFVPRVALTKEVGHFHVKGLLGRAFRAPVFENFSLSGTAFGLPPVKPETTTVFEVEAGYQFTSWLYAGANFFDNRVFDALVYQQDPVTAESSYVNAGSTGTRGIEADVRTRGSWGYATLGYSYYLATDPTENNVQQFRVEGQSNLHLGIPAHKFTARASFKLEEHFSFNPAVVVMSERYGLETPMGASDPVVTRFAPVVLVDAFFVLHHLSPPGLELSFGVHDLLGSNYKFVPGYNAGVNAMPGPGREFMVRLTYLRDFVK